MSASSFGKSSKTSYNDSHSSGTVQPFNFSLLSYPPFSPTPSSTIANSPIHQFYFTLYSTQSKNNQNEIWYTICQFFSIFLIFFSIRVFFYGYWQYTGQQGKGGDHFLFYSTTSTRSRTFRHLIATLHVRWLSHNSNHTACIYQTATLWDFPPYWISIRLIDDVILIFCLFTWWFEFGFCYGNLTRKTGQLELASTITLLSQANRLTKCVSHPMICYKEEYQYNKTLLSFLCKLGNCR